MNTSPVWTVVEWSLSDDFRKVAQQWNAIRRLLVDAEWFVRRDPAVSGWSCGEQAGHLALVINWIADEIVACPARFAHFALGYMTSSEWVRFCALHSAHHLAVVRDITGP